MKKIGFMTLSNEALKPDNMTEYEALGRGLKKNNGMRITEILFLE